MKDPIICFCNRVPLSRLQKSISDGAQNLAQIYDDCGAGTGPCGGSCRSEILRLIAVSQPVAPEHAPAELPPQLIEGISLFNRRYYWECHEVLEDLWMDEHGPHRLFYQGIIQAAAALYHVLNANPRGVVKLAEEALKKLRPYAPETLGVQVEPLITDIAYFLQESREIMGASKSGFNYDRLPQILIGTAMSPTARRE